MKESLKWQLLMVFLLTIAAAYCAYPSADKPLLKDWMAAHTIHPGLDLQGGSEILMGFKDEGKLSAPDIRSGLESARNTIEHRINSLGLKEPRINFYGDTQLQIQLPGVDPTELDHIKDVITTSGKLEFHIEATESYVNTYKDRRPLAPPGYEWFPEEATDKKAGDWLLLESAPVISGTSVVNAGWEITMKGRVVSLKLDPVASLVFEAITDKYKVREAGGTDPRRLAILLDGKIKSAPVLNGKISGGQAVIESGGRQGGFPEAEARDLAMILRSGSLPGTLEVRSETTVGASLGTDAINRAINAFIFAILAVVIFMLIYYHFIGFIAILALAINVVLLLGLLSLFNATLTLPGIAGIILTMGMAVDSNIIFYERIREEQDKGRSAKQAFEAGFTRALTTVVDANLTTLLAGVILWYFGTGSIRGFAITLSVGIVTTLFTGYFVTKLMLEFSIESGLLKRFTMFRMFTRANFDFVKTFKYFVAFSVIITTLGLVVFYMRGVRSSACYGVDFTSGTVLNVHFKNPMEISRVRDAVRSITKTGEAGVTIPKYGDAEVQSVILPVSGTATARAQEVGRFADEFQIRTRYVSTNEELTQFKNDLMMVFRDNLPREPLPVVENVDNAGYHVRAVLELDTPRSLADLTAQLKDIAAKHKKAEPRVLPPENAPVSQTEFTRFEIFFQENDPAQWQLLLRSPEGLNLRGVFPMAERFNSLVSRSLQQNAVLAIILSWIGMIIYLAFRFELKYGIAAVVALIHDVLVALGATVLFNWLVPDTWGVSVEVNFASVAAFMTIIGYSVNDTIVVFDRIRENLTEMKGATFGEVINASVNQTLSRTIITSLTVFLTVTILFFVTAQSGGGIPSFAFPMIIGTVIGTYSSIFIASPLVRAWSGDRVRRQ